MSLSFHFDFFPDVGLSGFLDVPLYHTNYSIKIICIYAHHQNELNEEIKVMCFICRFNVYFSRNQRKCSQNGEDQNLKI